MRGLNKIQQMASRVGSSAAFRGTKQWCEQFPAELVELPEELKVVSFTFDDFPASAVHNGSEILETYGARGTYYACMSMCRESSEPNPSGDYFHPENLERLAQGAHELACHSFDHPSLLTASNQQIVDTIEANAKALFDVIGTRFSPHFAFPYGLFRPNTRQLLSRYFRSLRTIHSGPHHGSVDLLALQSSPLLRDTSFESLETQVRSVAETGGWLTLYTHEVTASPSPYGTTPDALERVVTLCRDLGVEMLPVGDVVERLSPRTSRPPPPVPTHTEPPPGSAISPTS